MKSKRVKTLRYRFAGDKLKEDLLRQIKQEIIKPGEPILPERKLSEQYKISYTTVRAVISELERKGLLVRHQGRGTFVADPNRVAGVPRNSDIIAVIITDIEGYFFPEVIRGIEEVATADGYRITLNNTDNNPQKEARFVNQFRDKVDGLIIAPSTGDGKKKYSHLKELSKSDTPFVFIDRYIDSIKSSYVVSDNENGAYQVVKHLIKLGHKQIGHISLPECTSIKDRMNGYKKALAEYNIKVDKRLIKKGDFNDEESGYRLTKEFLKMPFKDRPSAIFAVNDRVAMGALRAIREKGLKVPEDIALVGYDDLPFVSCLEVPLTTVSQPRYEMGKEAAKLLIKIIKGEIKNKDYHIILKSKLVVRSSCGSNLPVGVST